jgi:serine/threonine protein kinase
MIDIVPRRYGQILTDTYKNFRDAEPQIHERIVRLRNMWNRTCAQLEFIRRVEHTLSPEHQDIQAATLDILAGKLKAACAALNGLVRAEDRGRLGKKGDVKRLKFARTKTSLDGILAQLQDWQELYDPSWYLILGVEDIAIDKHLRLTHAHPQPSILRGAASIRDSVRHQQHPGVHVFLPPDGLAYQHQKSIQFTTARLIHRTNSIKWFVTDSVPCQGANVDIMTKDIRSLAATLKNADPHIFGILRCQGVVKLLDKAQQLEAFMLIFETPTDSIEEPRSLRSHLIAQTQHSLSDRFALAKQIAKAVSSVHTFGFVHKNVRPETLLCFPSSVRTLDTTALIGFEQIRTADGRTRRQGDSLWSRNLYRHPERQGLSPSDDYRMQHDIYSLGVCLLEIGIWGSFLAYDGELATATELLALDLPGFELQTAVTVKNALVTIAEKQMPSSMGNAYMDIVVNCLTCLDESNADFGHRSEFEDEDGVLIGVRYIQKVSPPPSGLCTYRSN